jgi:hypothetical protein
VRKVVGVLGILIYVGIYLVVAVMIGEKLNALPFFIPLIYYVVAGVAWVLPLKPVLRWMAGPPKAVQPASGSAP